MRILIDTMEAPNNEANSKRRKALASQWLASHGDKKLRIRHELGFGGFSTCFLLTHPKHRSDEIAVKVIDRKNASPRNQSYIKRELAIHSKLNHPNIVQFYRYAADPELILIFMEYCSGGSMSPVIKAGPLPERAIHAIARQVSLALEYLHEANVVHRDVKPGNILIGQFDMSGFPKTVKLSDFGLSVKVNQETSLTSRCGTPYYFSPEMVKNEKYLYPTDLWSFGIFLYACFTGTVPFYSQGQEQDEIDSRIVNQEIVLPPPGVKMSHDAVRFLNSLLQRVPANRPLASDLKQAAWLFHDSSRRSSPKSPSSSASRQSRFIRGH